MTEEQIANLKKGETLEIPQADGTVMIIEGNPCTKCNKNIVGEIVDVDEGVFHPACFVCSNCGCSLLDEEYLEDEGELYCDDCYKECCGPRCYYCKQPIEDQAIQFNNRKYHTNHFGCFVCKTNLKGKQYKDVDGEPYCVDCAKKKEEKEKQKDLCFKCKEPIIGDFILVNGMKCHPFHYQCAICHAEFTGGSSIEFSGKRYCINCYKLVSAMVCEKCKKPIEGRSIQACGYMYHPDCLTCTECDAPLTKSSFFEHEGKPYCEFHFYRMFGDVCAKCGEPVKNNEGVHVGDKCFHHKCFVCSQCSKPMDPKKTKIYDNNPICMSCYNKLPGDVKYEIEEVEREQKRVEEKRKDNVKKQEKMDKKAEKKKEKEMAAQVKKAQKEAEKAQKAAGKKKK
ncbi:LIM domain containing protein unc-97, putative [Entamoeba invadens IP1]|uniref:LIM domain containing protein unc-97, putative n=1 Tax=Entamoeba invadens IP1 TaxID=370355 RepID=L7FK15_ENTIV|nr:LIM domain containing protein unc-97, putative [Entamoeba invadens IP1]ELP84900.1 LIM domain containing protein unc-97, putative [Entamoeba invadens IP1]|eukprot:XP_004184246.1 LIM domain containing protein unc-97, putative [Entamoeba invadens IP1]